jgi:hypothetical protein
VVKIEIEIPDPPEGWVFDGIRKAQAGEIALFHDGQWSKCQYSETYYSYLVAVKAKPLWEPSPELVAVLQPGWIARDFNGETYWYGRMPKRLTFSWDGAPMRTLSLLKRELLPPSSIPWDQSCFKIGEQE